MMHLFGEHLAVPQKLNMGGLHDGPVVRILLPMQGTWVRFLVLEAPVCCGPAKPECHNYWGACMPLGSWWSTTREKPLQGEAHEPQPGVPWPASVESPSAAGKTQYDKIKAHLKVLITMSPRNYTPRDAFKRTKNTCLHKNFFTNVHSPKVETIKISINWRINKCALFITVNITEQ